MGGKMNFVSLELGKKRRERNIDIGNHLDERRNIEKWKFGASPFRQH